MRFKKLVLYYLNVVFTVVKKAKILVWLRIPKIKRFGKKMLNSKKILLTLRMLLDNERAKQNFCGIVVENIKMFLLGRITEQKLLR